MNNFKQVVLILVSLSLFAGGEVVLFDSGHTTMGWTIFIVAFVLAIFLSGTIQGLFSGKKKDGV